MSENEYEFNFTIQERERLSKWREEYKKLIDDRLISPSCIDMYLSNEITSNKLVIKLTVDELKCLERWRKILRGYNKLNNSDIALISKLESYITMVQLCE